MFIYLDLIWGVTTLLKPLGHHHRIIKKKEDTIKTLSSQIFLSGKVKNVSNTRPLHSADPTMSRDCTHYKRVRHQIY